MNPAKVVARMERPGRSARRAGALDPGGPDDGRVGHEEVLRLAKRLELKIV